MNLVVSFCLFSQFNDALMYTTPVQSGQYKLNSVLSLAGMKVRCTCKHGSLLWFHCFSAVLSLLLVSLHSLLTFNCLFDVTLLCLNLIRSPFSCIDRCTVHIQCFTIHGDYFFYCYCCVFRLVSRAKRPIRTS